MAQERNTKQRMVVAAAESLRRRGLSGTSFTEVLADSGAARGAIYHHFPGGKADLVREAIAATGNGVSAALAALPDGPDEPAVVDAFLTLVRPVVQDSVAGAGCAIAAVVTESAPGDALQLASREVLDEWQRTLAAHLKRAGVPARRAAGLASLLLTTLEGAHILCRAAGDIRPFDRAAAALRQAPAG
jgi:TetR/AcrR family transcriptional regulator, lmrAB and yxaGH operons repressor